MSNVPEEPDREAIDLLKTLSPEPQRDPQAAASGKAKFLAEARTYRAVLSTQPERRHSGWKENTMRLTRIPVALVVIVVVGLAVVYLGVGGGTFYMSRSLVGNTFSTINNSLRGVGPAGADSTPQPTVGGAIPVPPGAEGPNQMVTKNADIRLLVGNTDWALDGVTQTVTDLQGYVIGSRTWYQGYNGKNYKYATLTIGVPVDQFENGMHRLRNLAVQILDENSSGKDVTDQYVHLQSQVTNLESTRDRIVTFLDQATTVDDILRIGLELSRVEAQIKQLKDQMNYLSNRSTLSTITINLEPQLP